jgi:hypothetical protein
MGSGIFSCVPLFYGPGTKINWLFSPKVVSLYALMFLGDIIGHSNKTNAKSGQVLTKVGLVSSKWEFPM